jgi:hypothetical protein
MEENLLERGSMRHIKDKGHKGHKGELNSLTTWPLSQYREWSVRSGEWERG